MNGIGRLAAQDRDALFQEAALQRGVSMLVVEKDFWVCWTLKRLFEIPIVGQNLIFKGGTSLSKVFKVINRFSEDIDLWIRRDYLGIIDSSDPEQPGISNNERRERVKASRQVAKTCTQEVLLPALTKSIDENLTGHEWSLESDPDDAGTLLFSYPTALNDKPENQYLKSQIKLEMGAGSDPYPIGEHPVRPYVAEEFPDQFSEPDVSVIALEAERTFWEKITLIHAECHRPEDTASPSRLSRHYYDIVRLAASDIGKKALQQSKLRERVVAHKTVYFRSGWANYETAKPGTLRLVPTENRLSELRADYGRMSEMFFETPPTFEDLLRSVATLEKRINDGEV